MFRTRPQQFVCQKNICVRRPGSDVNDLVLRDDFMGIAGQTTRIFCGFCRFVRIVKQSTKYALPRIVYCILYIVNILTLVLTKYIFCFRGRFFDG